MPSSQLPEYPKKNFVGLTSGAWLGTAVHLWQRACMERLGIRDLVGRAMIDKKFLTDLVRDPLTMLADYDLSTDEKNAIMQAVGRKENVSDQERARDLQHVMMK